MDTFSGLRIKGNDRGINDDHSGLISRGRGSGIENWGSWVLTVSSIDGGTKHTIEGIIPGIFFIYLYTNYSISEK